MTTEEMRVAITKVYDNPRWKERVSRMPSYQVMAIFYDFKKRGLFEKPVRLGNMFDYVPEPVSETMTNEEKSYGWDSVQLTMDEFLH